MSGIQIPSAKPSLDEVFSSSLSPSSPKLDLRLILPARLILPTVYTEIRKRVMYFTRQDWYFYEFFDKSINMGIFEVMLTLQDLLDSTWQMACITSFDFINNTNHLNTEHLKSNHSPFQTLFCLFF